MHTASGGRLRLVQVQARSASRDRQRIRPRDFFNRRHRRSDVTRLLRRLHRKEDSPRLRVDALPPTATTAIRRERRPRDVCLRPRPVPAPGGTSYSSLTGSCSCDSGTRRPDVRRMQVQSSQRAVRVVGREFLLDRETLHRHVQGRTYAALRSRIVLRADVTIARAGGGEGVAGGAPWLWRRVLRMEALALHLPPSPRQAGPRQTTKRTQEQRGGRS